ncbi:ABC transporter permease (plasmid) [Tundrisphaera sp. TA3]|uniref:ABC transporter permease n=1 Tax=Tundrisphaera sp. TA3 TaxID=3435775 RepID=UPI003EC07EA9
MHHAERPEIVLQAQSGWVPVNWREIYATRELLLTLIGRDLRVRYKQTVLGVGWAVIQPLLTMFVFAFTFSRFVPEMDTNGIPYPLYAYAGLVPWTFFSNAVNTAGISTISQQHLLTKIYFPRVYAPASPVGAGLVDMLVASGLFAMLLPFYRIVPSWQVVFLPLLIAVTFIATLGAGLATSALVVLFRDFRFVLSFSLQLLLFLTPVIFPATNFGKYAYLLALNPMFGLVDGFRAAVFGMPWNFPILAISTASAFATFLFGIYFFRRIERHIADII